MIVTGNFIYHCWFLSVSSPCFDCCMGGIHMCMAFTLNTSCAHMNSSLGHCFCLSFLRYFSTVCLIINESIFAPGLTFNCFSKNWVWYGMLQLFLKINVPDGATEELVCYVIVKSFSVLVIITSHLGRWNINTHEMKRVYKRNWLISITMRTLYILVLCCLYMAAIRDAIYLKQSSENWQNDG